MKGHTGDVTNNGKQYLGRSRIPKRKLTSAHQCYQILIAFQVKICSMIMRENSHLGIGHVVWCYILLQILYKQIGYYRNDSVMGFWVEIKFSGPDFSFVKFYDALSLMLLSDFVAFCWVHHLCHRDFHVPFLKKLPCPSLPHPATKIMNASFGQRRI